MKPNSKISAAVAAVLAAPATAVVFAAPPADTASATAGTEALAEVVVTANRREENLQNVPISVQALTGQTLRELNVQTLDDFVKYLPSVSTGSMGPGQSTLFMRGLSVGVLGTQGQGSVGGFPNVAVYLDEQSGQLPGRNLDVYAADLERVEVLEGPQGTLFGAGAEAGVIRYITNKPKLDSTSGYVTAGYGTTAHGDNNSDVTAVLNLPVIPEKMAVRLVIYNDSRGGYIDNLPATFTRSGTDLGLAGKNGGIVPTDSVSINNNNIVANNINPLTYQGLRASVLYKFSDDWDALLVQSYQDMNAQGVFYQMPFGSEGTILSPAGNPSSGQPLPPLSVNLFNPSYTKDRFENTALTVNGKLGDLRLVYAGSYLVRNIDQVQDYTNYARGVFGYYYQCTGVSYSKTHGNANATCYTPSTVWRDTERNTHLSQEMRLSTPDDWRLRGLVGLFYEDLRVYDDTEWLYKTVPECAPPSTANPNANVNCFLPIQPWPGPANRPGIRNSNTGFFDDFQRGYDQKAAFTSIDFDILPKVLTITGGTRWYDINNRTAGGDVGSFYCKQFSPTTYFGPCKAPYGTNLNLQNPNHLTAKGFRSRANLSWHVTPDHLLYYTWSQGYRPGGFNRGSSNQLPDELGNKQFATPSYYVSDSLTNNEIGWKTMWFDHRLQFNGAVYKEDWTNAQVGFFCPQCGLGNLTFGTNGPNYRVKGIEMQLVWRVIEGLTLTGSASWNSTEQTNSPSLIGNIPGSASFGKAITQHCIGPFPAAPAQCTPLIAVYGEEGTPLANSPPFQANLRARYEWNIGAYQAWAQFGFVHQAHSLSATGNVEAYDQPAWTTYDGSLGIGRDAWTVSLVGENLTDVNASLFTSSRQFILTETPMRPRVLSLRFDYRFEGK